MQVLGPPSSVPGFAELRTLLLLLDNKVALDAEIARLMAHVTLAEAKTSEANAAIVQAKDGIAAADMARRNVLEMRQDAETRLVAAKDKEAKTEADEKALTAREAKFKASVSEELARLEAWQRSNAAKTAALEALELKIKDRAAALDKQQADLDAAIARLKSAGINVGG